MDKRFFLMAALVVAFCTPPPGGCSSWLLPQAKAQSEAWVFVDKRVDMLGNNAPFPLTPLPAPGLPSTYNGADAALSQFVHTDGECRLVMFGIDGNLYDKDGYLMADANGTGCTECLEPGLMEMLALAVPDKCGLYYILSMSPGGAGTPDKIHIAVLDLNLDNPYFPGSGRKGRLLNLDLYELSSLYPDMLPVESMLSLSEGNSFFSVVLQAPGTAKSSSSMLRAIKVSDGYRLFVVHARSVVQYHITGTDFALVNATPLDPDLNTFGTKSNIRDASVIRTTGGEIRLAVTDNTIHEWPFAPDPPPHSVIVMRFDGLDGDLIDVQGLSPDQSGYPDFFNMNGVFLGTPGPGQESATGVAWINGGNKLLVTGREVDGTSWIPVITVYDMVTNSWLDLLPVLNIQGSLTEYVRARLYRNTPPNGEAGAIYIPHPGGLAAITGVDDGTYAFQAAVAGSSNAIPPTFAPPGGSPTYLPRFINAQVTDDNSVEEWNSEDCCEFRVSYEGYDGYDFPNVPGTYTWYGNNNPFGNCPEVIFLSDLVVPTGVILNIHDMVLRFAPTAHLIVQNAATANIFNSELRPLECPVERWQGIRVEGVSNNLAQSENIQGRLKLDHSDVVGAIVGVWCKREGSDQHYGGIVRAYYSSFEDWITDARIEKFHRYLVGQEWDNKCVFSNSRFRTTGNWADYGPALPGRHIVLYSVNGVAVKRCAFVNENPGAWTDPQQRGWGIFSPQATFKCNGFTDYPANRFENLGVGVVVSNGDPAWAYEIKGMGFANNFVGLYDMASVSSVLTNNKITTLASTSTFPGASVGFYFYQSQGYTCERNEFWDGDTEDPQVPSVGIWFRGPATMENRIYDNEFNGLNVGNAVQGDHADTEGTAPPSGPGLQLLCGRYGEFEPEVVDQLIL